MKKDKNNNDKGYIYIINSEPKKITFEMILMNTSTRYILNILFKKLIKKPIRWMKKDYWSLKKA